MKFKVDENLPAEAAEILREFGFIADTVVDDHLSGADDEAVASRSRLEMRVLITLDMDFANTRAVGDGAGEPKPRWRVMDRR